MKYSTVCAPSSDDLTTKKCKNDTETQLLTHQGGMVRRHLPLPLISHTKQLPEIVTVDIRQTIFCIISRCFILTPKAILPAGEKTKLPFGVCVSGQQEEVFYSMTATIVRLEENSYRQSWEEAEAVLFLPLSASSREV